MHNQRLFKQAFDIMHTGQLHRYRRTLARFVFLYVFCFAGLASAGDTTPQQQLRRWTQEAGRTANVRAGQTFFMHAHGREWSCASCHGTPPARDGKHASTGKRIAPLAPAFNPQALTQSARTDKWFRRNCNDVLGRECSAGEKADVLAYLLQLQPR
jgi:hypothetical protein